jgi:hypothetical protein
VTSIALKPIGMRVTTSTNCLCITMPCAEEAVPKPTFATRSTNSTTTAHSATLLQSVPDHSLLVFFSPMIRKTAFHKQQASNISTDKHCTGLIVATTVYRSANS